MPVFTNSGHSRIKRFAHPRQLVSWAGMEIREYASDGQAQTVTFASHRAGTDRAVIAR
jgi:hypothetical protein